MRDAMGDPAQRDLDPVGEWRRLRQPLEPRRNPSAVLLREIACLLETAARRNGQHHPAQRRIDAQRIAAGLTMAAQMHEIDRAVEDDLDRRGLGWTSIKERAPRHGEWTQEKFADEILPQWKRRAACRRSNKAPPQMQGVTPRGATRCRAF